jgi:hypothetical protein
MSGLRAHTFWYTSLSVFSRLSVSALVLLHILPESIEHGGPIAWGLFFLGLLTPLLIEKTLHHTSVITQSSVLIIAIGGLIFHAFIDGAALIPIGSHSSHQILPAAVILHRIPVGFLIWSLLCPLLGRRSAGMVLGLTIISTLSGFEAGHAWIAPLEESLGFAWFQALLAGSLLHVITVKQSFKNPSEA